MPGNGLLKGIPFIFDQNILSPRDLQGDFVHVSKTFDSRLTYGSGYLGKNVGSSIHCVNEWKNSLSSRTQWASCGGSESSQEFLSSPNSKESKFSLKSFLVDSPTLTTISERSEITEASCDLEILGIKHHRLSNQLFETAEYLKMQQSGYNEMQLLQQNLIYKQIQELQRQQQLQQAGDNSPQNSYSPYAKQASGSLYSPLINGMPVNEGSHLLRNQMQVMDTAATRGPLSRSIFAQEQSSSAHPMNPLHQHFDMSLSGSPVSEKRVGLTPSSYYQGTSSDTVGTYVKSNHHESKAMSGLGFFPPRDQSMMHSEFGVSEETFMPKQIFAEKGSEFSIHAQSMGGGSLSRNLQEGNSFQLTSSSHPDITSGPGEESWHDTQSDTKQLSISREMIPLDPLEAKILYNLDENAWDGFGDRPGLMNRSTYSNEGSSNLFSSFQGGSWSALMQSAVAESTSTDNGPQEEWNGLTIQNVEISDRNPSFEIADNTKQKMNWMENSMHTPPSSLKPFSMANDVNSSFSGFHPPGCQSSTKLKAHLHQDSFHGPINSLSPQQDPIIEENQKAQMFRHPGSVWSLQTSPSENVQGDIRNNKVASSAFNKFDKYQETTDRTPHMRMDNFQQNNVAANETYAKVRECYQLDGSASKGRNAHENIRMEQVKLFENVSNSIKDDEKSVQDFGGDIRVSRDARAGLQSFSINQTRSISSDAFVDDVSNSSVPQPLNQSVGFGHGFGLNLSPPSHNRSYTRNGSSTQAPVECLSSFQEEWGDTTLPANIGVSSDWKGPSHSYPTMTNDNDERQESLTPVSCQDTFPILEASTVSQPFLLSNAVNSDNSRNLNNLWRSKPTLQQQSYHSDSFKPLGQFSTMAELPVKVAGNASLNLGANNSLKEKSESSLHSSVSFSQGFQGLQHGVHFVTGISQKHHQEPLEDTQNNDIIHKQESDSFSFQSMEQCSQQNLASFGKGLLLNADRATNVLDAHHGNSVEEQLQGDSCARYKNSVGCAPSSFGAGEQKLLSFKEEIRNDSGLVPSTIQVSCSESPLFGHYSIAHPSAINSLSVVNQESVDVPLSSPWGVQSDILKNDQVVQNVETALSKSPSVHFPAEKSSDSLIERLDSGPGSSSTPLATIVNRQEAVESVPPSTTLEEETGVRPKKRKAEISYPLPWHKEVTHDSRKVDSISVAEKLWARATSRIIEKVEDESEIFEDIQPIYRSKRRVLLTSQLMQLLFLPFPKSLFTADFTSMSCDSLVYIVSRVSLGDSCSMACSKEIALLDSEGDDTTHSEETKKHCKARDPQFGKRAEVVITRLKRMEDEFQRLEKSASIVDLRTELQELEKFSVINRFAKFHGRGPLDSSGSSPMIGLSRLNIQRYVTAFPLPSNLPEGVQCLPL